MDYLVYTDGSCSAKDRVGGYAYRIIDEFGTVVDGGGSEVDTTISRMELLAVVSALWYLTDSAYGAMHILVFSDSQYVVKGFMDKSRARNKNVDLWNFLEEAAEGFESVTLEHVKGHAGQKDNEECDRIAGEFRRKALDASNSV